MWNIGNRKAGINSLAVALLAALCGMAILGSTASSATATMDIAAFDGRVTAGPEGEPFTQAGGHPFEFQTDLDFAKQVDEIGLEVPDEDVKTVRVDLPPGLVGNVNAVPPCDIPTFLSGGTEAGCFNDSQVGVVILRTAAIPVPTHLPLYNLVPPSADVPAAFGFRFLGVPVLLAASVRSSGDYGATVTAAGTSQGLQVLGSSVKFWGVPADPRHDKERCRFFGNFDPVPACNGEPGTDSGPNSVGLPEVPLLTMPTSCSPPGVGLPVTALVDSWQTPGVFDEASFATHLPPQYPAPPSEWGPPQGTTGCDAVPFDPSIDVRPGSSTAGDPTGLHFEVSFPQGGLLTREGRGTSHLRDISVTMPEGLTISPAGAAGLGSCTDAEFGEGSERAANCPEASRVGTVEAVTPVLSRPLHGEMFVAAQQGQDPESGSMYRLFLTLSGSGVEVKLTGHVRADAKTGRLTVSFTDNPQLPVSSVAVDLKSGPRALLVNPRECGQKTVSATLLGWSGRRVERSSTFSVEGDCDGASRFTPSLEAGTENPVAGQSSPFVLRLTGVDGQPNVSSIEATLPQGLLAKLAGVPYCPESQAASGDCPASSQVGTATVGAGSGSNPIYVPQPGKAPTAIYLAGPYKGAPISIVVRVPAQAGPFDLGTVAVRNALRIDPSTAQVTAKSDPLPQIIAGVPISYRDIRVEMDRPDFILNPTSCKQMAVTSSIASVAGSAASPSSRFQAADCADLGFKPKLALRFSGAPARRGGYPTLTATLRMPKGGANVDKAVVRMPETEFLENAHIRTVCTRVQYTADDCPKGSVYGYAKAWTPLLDKPLEGPVYLRSSNHTLPDLVASLDGQIHIDLAGRIDSPGGRIRSTFWAVPDAPVSKFVLTMQGGRKGLLVNNTNLCRTKPRASASFLAQNGKSRALNPLVKVAGCGKGRQ